MGTGIPCSCGNWICPFLIKIQKESHNIIHSFNAVWQYCLYLETSVTKACAWNIYEDRCSQFCFGARQEVPSLHSHPKAWGSAHGQMEEWISELILVLNAAVVTLIPSIVEHWHCSFSGLSPDALIKTLPRSDAYTHIHSRLNDAQGLK